MKNKTLKLIIIIVTILIVIDQISKLLISNFLQNPIGNEYIKFEITNNTGMAFGFNSGNLKNIFITLFILFIVIKFVKNQIDKIDKKSAVAISLVLSGGISNLIDRIIRGSVLDFIKLKNFAVFNIADTFIVIRLVFINNIFNRLFKKIEVKLCVIQ